MGYLDFIISDNETSLSGKTFAIKLRKVVGIKHRLVSSYEDGDNQDEIYFENLLQEINDAIILYSKEF